MKLASIFPMLALAAALSSCSTVKKVTQIPVPSLPSLPSVPFFGNSSSDQAPAYQDREVPYQVNQTLGAGHTLKFAVYAGQHNPKKLYSGTAVVDDSGLITLKKKGEVKVGGLKAAEAAHAIGVLFRREYGQFVINVQLEEVEGQALVLVEGAVNRPGAVAYYDGSDSLSVLKASGGIVAGNRGQAVYITRDGRRKFYPTAATTEGGLPLQAGDIIHFSSEL